MSPSGRSLYLCDGIYDVTPSDYYLPVMAAPIIPIFSNTLEESVGSSTSRVVLFVMIPTIILADVSTLVHATIPSVIHDSVAEISILSPREPKAGVTIVASPTWEIPFGRPYRTQPNGVLRMMTARKRVHTVPVRISANRKRLHSLSSSPPPKRSRTSSCSSSSEGSFPDSSTSLSERIRGSSDALFFEVTIKESLEVGSEEDIDLDGMVDIEADITAEAAAADEIRAETEVGFRGDDEAKDEAESSARGTMEIRVYIVFELEILADSLVPASGGGSREDFEIGLDVVIQELYDHMEEIYAQRISDIEEEQRAREIRALADERERWL
nr:hypothetical protein [Tanacetum cinerariifolium]